jgi:hypothetical protein
MLKDSKNLFTFTSYFKIGDEVLMGKFKNSKGKIVDLVYDQWGNPMLEIEPIPKGRKKNRTIGLFRIWRADIKET